MAALSTTMPSLSRARVWDTQHLIDAATRWTNAANVLDDAFTAVEREIGVPWKGEAAEAAMRRAALDRLKVVAIADDLRNAAAIASRGAGQLADAKQAVLSAVARAQEDGFEVAEDLSVTDPDFSSPIEAVRAAREALAQSHANQIGTQALKLGALDRQIAAAIAEAAGNIGQINFDDTPLDTPPTEVVAKAADFKTTAGPDAADADDGIHGFSGEPWLYPWDPPPPPDSAPGGGHWSIDYTQPYEAGPAGGPPMGIAPPKPWHRKVDPPVVGGSSGLTEVVVPPRAKPLATLQEAYRFRVVGEGFSGAADHVRWVQRNGKWYQATWVGYDLEAEHVRSVAGHHNAKGLAFRWGFNKWNPIDIKEIYQLQVRNPRLPLFIPNTLGGQYDLPAGKTAVVAG